MKVISREVQKNAIDGTIVIYKLSTGHEAVATSDRFTAYTPAGNYASQITAQKISRVVSEYEDRRIQWPN